MLSNLLPQTDNFFKYILTIGIVLLLFTIVYPIQKEKEYNLEYLRYLGEKELLDFKINSLKSKFEDFKLLTNYTQKEIDSLKLKLGRGNLEQDKFISGLRNTKKQEYDSLKVALLNVVDSLQVNNINLKIQKNKIEQLRQFVSIFSVFKWVILPISIFLMIIGFRYWASSVYLDELKKCKDYDQEYKSSFIRHCDFILKIIKKGPGRVSTPTQSQLTNH